MGESAREEFKRKSMSKKPGMRLMWLCASDAKREQQRKLCGEVSRRRVEKAKAAADCQAKGVSTR